MASLRKRLSEMCNENDRLNKSIDELGITFDKCFGITLDDLVDAYDRSQKQVIIDFVSVEDNSDDNAGKYIRLLVQNGDDIEVAAAQRITCVARVNDGETEINDISELIPVSFVTRLMEFAYLGFTLVQEKTYKTHKVSSPVSTQYLDE